MKSGLRIGALAALVACGVALTVVLQRARVQPPLESTFTSAFQIVGAPLKLVDRAATRVLPVSELDEKELGDVYRASYDPQAQPPGREQRYLDSLVAELRPFTGKPFPYRAYVVDYPAPNAMALPGGVILVTRELLTTLQSESELVGVLAHEIGHIERGHCFDTVRFELLARKVGAEPLGALADIAAQVLLRHSYSKTMEHEADAYAFELMTNGRYDPRGVAGGSVAAGVRDHARRGLTAARQPDPRLHGGGGGGGRNRAAHHSLRPRHGAAIRAADQRRGGDNLGQSGLLRRFGQPGHRPLGGAVWYGDSHTREWILRPGPHEGVVVNIPEMRLYYYVPKRDGAPAQVLTYPVGLGRQDWQTPQAEFRIRGKTRNPTWIIPESIKKERIEKQGFTEDMIPGGSPDNPLGKYRIELTLPMYGIHGSNKEWGVGMQISHGCIRMYPEDIETLFNTVQIGSSARFVYEPTKVGLRGGRVMVEVHDDIYGVAPWPWMLAQQLVKEMGLARQVDRARLVPPLRVRQSAPQGGGQVSYA